MKTFLVFVDDQDGDFYPSLARAIVALKHAFANGAETVRIKSSQWFEKRPVVCITDHKYNRGNKNENNWTEIMYRRGVDCRVNSG